MKKVNDKYLARIAAFLTMAIIVIASPAAGHDSWLIADRSSVNDGEDMWLSFVTGDAFPFGDAATDPKRIASFVDQHGDAVTNIVGFSPEDNALSVRGPISGGGIHILGCELKPRLIEMEPDVFDEYLKKEQADKAIAARKSHNRHQRVVERYSKFAKTVVEVYPTDASDTNYERPLGHRLEIIPLSNPIRWQASSTIRLKVLLDGHPWPGVTISSGHESTRTKLSGNQDEHRYASRSRTDADGIASVTLTQTGHWFIKAHHIRPSNGLARHQWESFWATLTFRVQGIMNIDGDIRAMKAVHGEITPWVVAGYRMGKRALTELSLKRGSPSLLAIHRTPLEIPYTSMADGIQAATAATVGKLNLHLENVPKDNLPTGLRSDFLDRSNSRIISFRLKPDLLENMLKTPPEAAEAMAMKMLTMSDDEIFVTNRTKDDSEHGLTGNTQNAPPGTTPTKAVRANSQSN